MILFTIYEGNPEPQEYINELSKGNPQMSINFVTSLFLLEQIISTPLQRRDLNTTGREILFMVMNSRRRARQFTGTVLWARIPTQWDSNRLIRNCARPVVRAARLYKLFNLVFYSRTRNWEATPWRLFDGDTIRIQRWVLLSNVWNICNESTPAFNPTIYSLHHQFTGTRSREADYELVPRIKLCGALRALSVTVTFCTMHFVHGNNNTLRVRREPS